MGLKKRRVGPEPVDVCVGSQIKIHRRLRGMSQTALATGIGVTFQQVQKYEKGENRVGSSRPQHIAAILNVPVSAFFVGAELAGRGKYTDHLVQICDATGALELTMAFIQIESKQLRRSIIELVEAVAKTPEARREA